MENSKKKIRENITIVLPDSGSCSVSARVLSRLLPRVLASSMMLLFLEKYKKKTRENDVRKIIVTDREQWVMMALLRKIIKYVRNLAKN